MHASHAPGHASIEHAPQVESYRLDLPPPRPRPAVSLPLGAVESALQVILHNLEQWCRCVWLEALRFFFAKYWLLVWSISCSQVDRALATRENKAIADFPTNPMCNMKGRCMYESTCIQGQQSIMTRQRLQTGVKPCNQVIRADLIDGIFALKEGNGDLATSAKLMIYTDRQLQQAV